MWRAEKMLSIYRAVSSTNPQYKLYYITADIAKVSIQDKKIFEDTIQKSILIPLIKGRIAHPKTPQDHKQKMTNSLSSGDVNEMIRAFTNSGGTYRPPKFDWKDNYHITLLGPIKVPIGVDNNNKFKDETTVILLFENLCAHLSRINWQLDLTFSHNGFIDPNCFWYGSVFIADAAYRTFYDAFKDAVAMTWSQKTGHDIGVGESKTGGIKIYEDKELEVMYEDKIDSELQLTLPEYALPKKFKPHISFVNIQWNNSPKCNAGVTLRTNMQSSYLITSRQLQLTTMDNQSIKTLAVCEQEAAPKKVRRG